MSNRFPPAPVLLNTGFRDRTGTFTCETNRRGNGQWKKLMMEMKALQEKKARLEEQHLVILAEWHLVFSLYLPAKGSTCSLGRRGRWISEEGNLSTVSGTEGM